MRVGVQPHDGVGPHLLPNHPPDRSESAVPPNPRYARGTTASDLDASGEALAVRHIRATYLVLACSLRNTAFVRALTRLLELGHEVGCHGFDHSEDFVSDPISAQADSLHRSRDMIESKLSTPVRVFRAPAFRIGRDTVRALEREQFIVDMSVNPQRLCLFSSHPTNVGWMKAPRRPYWMDRRDPNRRGTSHVLEIPTSSFMVPLSSTLYQAFGVPAALRFTEALGREAARGPGPLVFAGHPEDFRAVPGVRPATRSTRWQGLRWKEFLPAEKGGITLRYRLYETNRDAVAFMATEYFSTIARMSKFEFVTVAGYMRQGNCEPRV